MKTNSLWILFVCLLLSACATKQYVPVPSASYHVEERFAIVSTDSLTIFIRPQTFRGEAESVSSNFFNLYIRIKNTSDKPIAVSRQSFSLLYQKKQFDYVPLQIVLGSIRSNYLEYPLEDPFATGRAEAQNQSLVVAQQQYFDLVSSYFTFGEILAGGIKEGYLFYNDKVGRRDPIEIDALGTRVTFERR